MIRETDLLPADASLSAPQHRLISLQEQQVDIVKPGKVTVLYFFAPWCHVCHASIDNLQMLYDKRGDIEVVAIAMDFEHREAVDDFVAQHELTFDVVLGNWQAKQDYQIKGYPTYYVIDAQGMISGKSMGYSSFAGLLMRTL